MKYTIEVKILFIGKKGVFGKDAELFEKDIEKLVHKHGAEMILKRKASE